MQLINTFFIALCFGTCAYFVFFRGIVQNASQAFALYTGPSFRVPKGCKHLALLGCTPHPTEHLNKKGTMDMSHLKLGEFLDVNELKDSFTQVLTLCKNNKVDHLLIAYLPIYFVDMRSILKNNFIIECKTFLTTIAPQVALLVNELKNKLYPSLTISLVVPDEEALKKVPTQKVNDEKRIRYSIKQFPRLLAIDESLLETITIINNKDSGQDEGIINYLKYEYLFEKPLQYRALETAKKKFHFYT